LIVAVQDSCRGSFRLVRAVEGEKTGDGISYTSHVKNVNPRKARATTFYDPVRNARVDIKRLRTEGGRKAEEAIGVAS
jgi:hypothetical protein